MPSSTVENYLKQIYLEESAGSTSLVGMGILARRMEVTPGTATSMVKGLSDTGYVTYEPREGLSLTPKGRRAALDVLRKHRLVELLLVQVLGLDWSEVHDEAEALEHVISDRLLEHIDELLGHPTVDPHGDPIPGKQGQVEEPFLVSLTEWDLGTKCKVTRVTDQNPEFLQYIDRTGLVPGAEVEVTERVPAAETVTLHLTGRHQPLVLSYAVARKILVSR